MVDNLKKKKRDSKRLNINQSYEIAYVVKKSKELKKLCDGDIKVNGNRVKTLFGARGTHVPFSVSTIRRICIAVIKLSKKRK